MTNADWSSAQERAHSSCRVPCKTPSLHHGSSGDRYSASGIAPTHSSPRINASPQRDCLVQSGRRDLHDVIDAVPVADRDSARSIAIERRTAGFASCRVSAPIRESHCRRTRNRPAAGRASECVGQGSGCRPVRRPWRSRLRFDARLRSAFARTKASSQDSHPENCTLGVLSVSNILADYD